MKLINNFKYCIMSKMGQLFCNMFCNCGEIDSIDDNFISIKVWADHEGVKLPEYSKPGDACMDIYADSVEADEENNRVIIRTGLHFAIPFGYEMEIRPRSSLTKYRWIIANSPGTIDSGYRGEVLIIFTPLDKDVNLVNDFPFSIGDRVCQFLVKKRPHVYLTQVSEYHMLGETERGSGGFGSTGK